jgi:monovalent cation:H+ antiporter, CPA1 family
VPSPTGESLAAIPLFASMTEDARQRLAEFLEVEYHHAGHQILHQGQSGYAFYVIASGSVEVTRDGEPIRQMGAGDYFGELAILGGGRRTAAVTAIDDVEVWALFGTHFRELASAEPDVADALVNAASQRLNDT